jgi:hypothetical protein
MSVLKGFEQHAIDLLLEGVLPLETIEAVKGRAELVGYEYTGVGYFLTLRHSALPRERLVCDKLRVVASSRDLSYSSRTMSWFSNVTPGAMVRCRKRIVMRMSRSLQPDPGQRGHAAICARCRARAVGRGR